jgi:predicted nuclease of predicted toxin-antitoxin system
VKFYVDASVPVAVRKALAEVRDDICHAGEPGYPAESTRDADWLRAAGENDWVVIKRDKKIRTRPGERQALLTAGVRTFCLTGAGNYSRWKVLQLLATRWDRIEELASSVEGPYVHSVTQAGVRRLPLD